MEGDVCALFTTNYSHYGALNKGFRPWKSPENLHDVFLKRTKTCSGTSFLKMFLDLARGKANAVSSLKPNGLTEYMRSCKIVIHVYFIHWMIDSISIFVLLFGARYVRPQFRLVICLASVILYCAPVRTPGV